MVNIKYLFEDCPILDIPPKQESVVVPNGNGDSLFLRILKPAISSEHEQCPAVIFFHGFPGHEKLYDIAQALRGIGFVSILGAFSGCWGCGGEYSFERLSNDAKINIQYIIEHAKDLNVDPKRIYLVGHSMGGFTTIKVLTEISTVKGAVLLAPCNIISKYTDDPQGFKQLVEKAAPFLTLKNNDTSILCKECSENVKNWDFVTMAKKIRCDIPILLIGGSNDTTCPPATHVYPISNTLQGMNQNFEMTIYESDHSFQNKRITLTKDIANWICSKEAE